MMQDNQSETTKIHGELPWAYTFWSALLFPRLPFIPVPFRAPMPAGASEVIPSVKIRLQGSPGPPGLGPPFRFADSPVWSFLSGLPGPPPAASRDSAGTAFDLIARGPHAHRGPARSPTAVSHVPLFSSDGTPLAGFGRGPVYLAATWPRALHGLS